MPTLKIPRESKMHRRYMAALESRMKLAETEQQRRHEEWRRAEENVLAYVPESSVDAKRRSAREAGDPRYTTIQIPYTYAMLLSAHTYWTSVFFARDPVHQFKGLHGETEQQTQALEALIAYQLTAGEMLGPYYIWLYDAGKYGVGVLGTYWAQEQRQITLLQDDQMHTQQIPGYEGNKVYNISPFDFFPDPRVPVGRFQDGEFCAVQRRISWNDVIRREKAGFYTNIEALREVLAHDEPQEESYSALERPTELRTTVSDPMTKHPSMVEVIEMYIELIPSEWELGSVSTPEKWVFSFTSGYELLIGAQPLGLIHGKFPVDVLETEIEAYGAYNRGLPEIMRPLQNTMDWLLNTHFFNVRASLNNMFLVNPTMVVMKDFDNAQPGGFIRLKPEAYGQDLRTFFHQIPIQNLTQQNFTDLNIMQQFGERTLGINDQIMGGLSGGGRKTATEVRTSTGFGVNRLKTTTEYMSATGFSLHAAKLVANSQQFYNGEKKFRIVGSLAIEAGQEFLSVSPENIAGSFGLVPVDGTLPIDRMMQANLWKEILMNIGRVPQIAMQYDISRIFAWMASLAGLKNINQFRVQVLPPGAPPSPGMVQAPQQLTNPATTGLQGANAPLPVLQ